MRVPPNAVETGEAIIGALKARQTVVDKVMIVAAHPDDETIGVGAQLCRLDEALIVHVTDGAPRNGHDRARYGFATIEAYANARRRELADALAASGATSLRTLAFDIPDQEACRDLAGLARRIADQLASEKPRTVITHAYEGGHPDHDSVAFAVRAACRLLPSGNPPAITEMALYHRREGRVASGDFLPADTPVTAIALDDNDARRKRRMIDCFTTQRWLLAAFPLECERLRPAPDHDFREPPHAGLLHYETLGWDITGAQWRHHAEAALAELGLANRPCR